MEIEPLLHASRANTPTPHYLHHRQADVNTTPNTANEQTAYRSRVAPDSPTVPAHIHTRKVSNPAATSRYRPYKSSSLSHQQNSAQDSTALPVHHIPESTSAGREGRQFTVANVGNNGRIFLRPTVRSANQRAPQPSFVFPMTPPATAEIRGHNPPTNKQDSSDNSLATLSPTIALPIFPTVPTTRAGALHVGEEHPYPRGQSSSAADESQISQDDATGAFKVVIDRPGTARPSTSGDPTIKSILEVAIPSWRIGTPRFSLRGTAFIRGSSYAGSVAARSSTIDGDNSGITPRRPGIRFNEHAQVPSSDGSGLSHADQAGGYSPVGAAPIGPMSTGSRVIEPSMFDNLSFRPTCDDRSLARHALNGTLTAGTPPRLVAEITSQTFLDYDLLSDFFLTFRPFISTSDLLSLLIARLRWALARSDGIGMIVRVRTFVALRHWILNYFMDDYVLDFGLRKMFCDLINTFVEDILQSKQVEKNQVKILEEIKKCWRRTCSLFWTPSDSSIAAMESSSPIVPGGVPGSRDANLPPDFWTRAMNAGPPRLDDIFDHDALTTDDFNFFADIPNAGEKQITPSNSKQSEIKGQRHGAKDSSASRDSAMSQEIISCSFPRLKSSASRTPVLGPRPALVPSSCYDTTVTSPRSDNVNRIPPQSDRYEESSMAYGNGEANPGQVVTYNGTELLMSMPYQGSLVRGNVLPPGQAYVDFVSPTTPAEVLRATTYFPRTDPVPQQSGASATPGMKRLLGSVRRVLKNKPSSPTPGTISSPTSVKFPSGISSEFRVFDPVTVSDQRFIRHRQGKIPLRIDLLGASIAEDFKRAVREDAEADAEAERALLDDAQDIDGHGHDHDHDGHSSSSMRERNLISGITAGTRSIVIWDDTVPANVPKVTGALATYPSIETIADSFTRPLDDLTPPTTPLDARRGFPRRSSQLLGTPSYSQRRSSSADRTPPLGDTPSLVHELPDVSVTDQSPSLARVIPMSSRFHSRNKSSKSTSLLRYASFQSMYARRASDTDLHAMAGDMMPEDHPYIASHTLRRRPGGNLRDATNVDDLRGSHLRRTLSTGSIETFSESMRSRASYAVTTAPRPNDVVSNGINPSFSRRGPSGSVEGRRLPIYSTGISGVPVHPSMEKELAILAQIPDDDDGGIESSLLKLEGKFEGSRQSDTPSGLGMYIGAVPTNEGAEQEVLNDQKYHGEEIPENMESSLERIELDSERPQAHRSVQKLSYGFPQRQGVYALRETQQSDESFSSVPLLQRDQSVNLDEAKRNRRKTFVIASPQTISDELGTDIEVDQQEIEDDIDYDSDAESDISSEMSLLLDQDHESQISILPTLPQQTLQNAKAVLPLGALRVPSSSSMSLYHALAMTPIESARDEPSPLLYSPQLYGVPPQPFDGDVVYPPTPDATPTMTMMATPKAGDWDFEGFVKPSLSTVQPGAAARDTSVHLPFILAYPSKLLAEQFTLIEKDALNEVDWKELIDMKWRDTSTDTRSWVDFLRTNDAHGVEVVISRFNVMCKWAISEIVLCRNLEERVQCIIKYIHIAAHCRTYRNYATLYQITIALTGTEISRLKETWSHVPEMEKRTLKALEDLLQPIRNFHNLRAEMEGEGTSVGCIPFIGVYTHDLLLNAQKPSIIASTPMSEPLINFERCRTSATIVKNLLRLLEASQLYEFRPVEGVTQRCLWMAALSDEEIRRLGEGIN